MKCFSPSSGRGLQAGLAIVFLTVVGGGQAQSLTTSISGYAEVKSGATPDRREFAQSTAGDPLDENRELQLSSSRGGISSGVSGAARARATASAAHGTMRASVLTAASYSQFFYVPGPGEGSLVLAPATTNLYTPATSAQATVESTDRLTVTSTSAPVGTMVPMVFTLSLDAQREISYSADGIARSVNDATTPLYPYSGAQFTGNWTPREPYVPMTSGLSLVIRDEENPLPAVVTRVLSSRVNFWHFRTITSDVPVTLAVGRTYRLEIRLDASSRSDGGTTFQPDSSEAGPWGNDPDRLTNRGLSVATNAFASVVIAPTDATVGFTTASGARYDGAAIPPPPSGVAPPQVVVKGGRKQRAFKDTHLLDGVATGVVTRIGVRVRGNGPFRTAAGLRKWRFKVGLKPGANRVEVRAEGPGGNSPVQRVVITRR